MKGQRLPWSRTVEDGLLFVVCDSVVFVAKLLCCRDVVVRSVGFSLVHDFLE